MSLASYPFHKLQPQFYGPFQIMAKVGPMAYKLQFPKQSKLHHVFHVSCLKKYLGTNVQTTTPLLVITDVGIIQDVPITIFG